MAVHSFWIFDRHTHCIFHREYNHQIGKQGINSNRLYPGKINTLNDSDESKLLYGMIYSLRNISNELTIEKDDGNNNNNNNNNNDDIDDNDDADGDKGGKDINNNDKNLFNNSLQLNNNNKIFTINTLNYKIQILETLSGLKIVVLIDVNHKNLQQQLQNIFDNIYVPLIVDNCMSSVEFDKNNCNEIICPQIKGDTTQFKTPPNRRDAVFIEKIDKLLLS